MRIGIFGGTFDPPHLGHIILAFESLYQLSLDRIVWLLTPHPPHKENKEISSVIDRLNMVKLISNNYPEFEVTEVEIKRNPPHYAVDTMKLLKEEFQDDELIFLMGGDSLRDLPSWHKPVEFIQTCDGIGVMRRPWKRLPISELEDELPGLSSKLNIIEAPLLEISSAQIRRRAYQKRPYWYYLPKEVVDYIKDYELYR